MGDTAKGAKHRASYHYAEVFGKLLKQRRQEAGLTQRQFAVRVGHDPSYISMLEIGKRRATPTFIHKMARVLDLPDKSLTDLLRAAGYASLPLLIPEENHKTTLVWHSTVHERFGERLRYYFLQLRLGYGTFDKLATNIRDSLGIPGFCLYEIYGPYDLLLRVWLNPSKKRQLESYLSSAPEISNIAAFETQTIQAVWRNDEGRRLSRSQQETLSTLDPAVVKSIQEAASNGEANDTIHRLITEGLVTWHVPAWAIKEIKFWILIEAASAERTFEQSEIVDSLKRLLTELEDRIGYPSLYTGVGATRILLEGTVADFFDIGVLMNRIHETLYQYDARILTFSLATPRYIEQDDIAPDSLYIPTMDVPEVLLWLPELQEEVLGSIAPEHTMIAKLAIENNLFSELEVADRDFIRNLFVQKIYGQNHNARATLLIWTADTERELRAWWDKLLRAISRGRGIAIGDLQSEYYKSLDVGGNHQYIPLAKLVALVSRATREYSPESEEVLVQTQFEIRGTRVGELRNRLAHGVLSNVLESFDEWRSMIVELSEFIVAFRKLQELSKKIVDV